ncbi:non-hydrolyzing UDP-N-acetylglucosamine 2-epimerase [Aliikangiella sp. IMCC44359]|uniref:non-hydrolyzing UDP-N-acetylglucosamine 2-epimerase n=1 Tax=Aliikangiella sp. IMCC44359 TaxID=3459125 RepID=UPI00403AD6B3
MKVATVVGARPQFVKVAAVSRAFADYRSDVKEVIIHTGQHYDSNMSDIFFDELKIPTPQYNLGVGGGTHGQNTGRMIEKIEEILLSEKPDWLLIFGDTDSTLAGAVAASKLHIPVAHVEAGLRSFNREMPEEINRILADHVSSLLLTPTDTATKNLAIEGISKEKVNQVGDVMQDAALFYQKMSYKPSSINISKEFVLATVHRAENTNDPERLKSIFTALNEISLTKTLILPLHPRTQAIVKNADIDISNILIIDPVGYLEMLWLLERCDWVLTDSGGLQKEAFFFGKPCLTARDQTEWVELVDSGANILVGANKSLILECAQKTSAMTIDVSSNMYGGGLASKRIVELF